MTDDRRSRPIVLVADDDPAMRLMMRTALEDVGLVVHEANDGAGAIEAFERDHPALVLLDVEMPGCDGYAACEAIRRNRAGRTVPIIMVTGRDNTASVDRAYAAGATDFISKPINWTLIGHRIRYILRSAETLKALAVSESKNRALLQAIPDRIFILDHDGTVQDYLSGANTLGDSRPGDMVGRDVWDVMPPQVATRVLECLAKVLSSGKTHSFEFTHTASDGTKRYYESRFVRHRVRQVMAIVRDISERKEAEARIHHLAYYDGLTGLPNRRMFFKHLRKAIAKADRRGEMVATLYIDLDRFKRINDTLGHNVGDALLHAVAERLGNCVAAADGAWTTQDCYATAELARLGGDEFTVLLRGIAGDEDAANVGDLILQALSRPFQYAGHEFVVTPSIGISVYPRDGQDAETLMKNADTAMYEAKAAGRNSSKIYAGVMNSRSLERLALENDLRRAVENGEFEIRYQPKFDVRDLTIVGAEALLRWTHPERGEISPGTFIPLAEETGLIIELDRWVASDVCGQIGRWQQQGITPVPIAINLSGQEFCHGDPAQMLVAAAMNAGIDPANLELEITESVLMRDVPTVKHRLLALREHGFGLSVDDFGTGYSSLAYLKGFPINALKIDQSFVRDINTDPDDGAICEAIIALGHSLGLHVVAEGVERDDQLDFLRHLGCDQIQGYLLSRALPADRFGARLAQQNRAGRSRGADVVRLRA